MTTLYIAVLLACTLVVVVLVLWRLLHLRHHPSPSPGRLLNEWIWTVVPVAILAGLLWRALMAK